MDDDKETSESKRMAALQDKVNYCDCITAMIAVTRTATITMVMRLIPATMGTLIATARVMNRDVSLIVTAVTAA